MIKVFAWVVLFLVLCVVSAAALFMPFHSTLVQVFAVLAAVVCTGAALARAIEELAHLVSNSGGI